MQYISYIIYIYIPAPVSEELISQRRHLQGIHHPQPADSDRQVGSNVLGQLRTG